MVLAVVGTMKAGKSTTINAIVGKEILPNRNRPMTSLPTLIRHVPGKSTPDLQLNNIEPIRLLIATLKAKIVTNEGKARIGVLKQDQEKSKLLNIVKDIDWVKNSYSGEEEIFTCLASLNDLVRLATALDVAFPFEAYKEVQELPVIEVEFSHLTGMENSQGTLTLLDTPGPNEAEQPHLQAMMRDQLKKASAVLAVLDYTQMSSEADQQVRSELNDIAKVAAGRLFVLVNKFDQKDRNSDNADTVKQSVPAMLQPGMLTSERVYPGSSRHAYLANRARSMVSKGGHLSAQEGWVEDFAQLAFGFGWEDEITNVEHVCLRADKIWQHSLFDRLITEVVQAAHAKAAALAVDSAAAKLVQNGEDTSEYLSVRHQGLKTSIKVLKTQIDELMSDIENIATCQEKVSIEVKHSMNGIKQQTKKLLEGSDKTLNDSVDEFFESGKQIEKTELDEQIIVTTPRLGIFSSIFNQLNSSSSRERRRSIEFDWENPIIKFSEKEKAQEFLQQIEEYVVKLLTDSEKEITPILKNIIGGIEESFKSNAIQVIDKIAKQINARLEDDGFSVNIKFPDVKHLQTNLDMKTRMATLLEEKSFRETRSRRKDNAWGKVCKFFNTDDWGWEDYTVNVTHNVVDIRKIRTSVFEQTKVHFEELNNEIEASINQPLLKEIKTFFSSFKGKVEQLRNTLIQSTNDHKNDQKKQEQLTERLQELNRITPDMLRDSKALKDELEPML